MGEQRLASLTEAQTAGFLEQAALPKLTRLVTTLDFLFVYSPVSSRILYTRRSQVAAESQGCST